MHFSTITLAFAAAVLGAPTETLFGSGLRVRGDLDQGDGYYLAVFNETGVADVEFTPLTELKARAPVEEVATAHTASLLKRGTVCSGRRSGNLAQLDQANVDLANNAARQGWYERGAHGWVHIAGETSYFCNYQGNQLNYNLIIDMHSVITNTCGRDAYGFDRRTNGGGANDLAVGRTFRGDGFC